MFVVSRATFSTDRHNLRSSSGAPAGASLAPAALTSHTLSPGERDVCDAVHVSVGGWGTGGETCRSSQRQITADVYLVMKEQLVRAYLRTGHISRSDARLLLSLPTQAAEVVFDFCEQNGWINGSDKSAGNMSSFGGRK